MEADLDKEITDTVEANKIINQQWSKIKTQFASIDLDFSGELDRDAAGGRDHGTRVVDHVAPDRVPGGWRAAKSA